MGWTQRHSHRPQLMNNNINSVVSILQQRSGELFSRGKAYLREHSFECFEQMFVFNMVKGGSCFVEPLGEVLVTYLDFRLLL